MTETVLMLFLQAPAPVAWHSPALQATAEKCSSTTVAQIRVVQTHAATAAVRLRSHTAHRWARTFVPMCLTPVVHAGCIQLLCCCIPVHLPSAVPCTAASTWQDVSVETCVLPQASYQPVLLWPQAPYTAPMAPAIAPAAGPDVSSLSTSEPSMMMMGPSMGPMYASMAAGDMAPMTAPAGESAPSAVRRHVLVDYKGRAPR